MDNRKKSPLDVEYTSGGIFMPRSYRHISNYEKEILELKAHGLTTREIGSKHASQKSKYIISLHNITKNNER